MDDIVDVNALLEPAKTGNEISAIERLLNEFEAHEAEEETALEQYRSALADVTNPINRFVLQLIISDEEKHRAVSHALVATLKGSLNWTKPEGSLEGGTDPGPVNDKLFKVTKDFIELEKRGIREYKTLLKESSGYYHGLFKILINSMIRDSEKHVEMLEFLAQRLHIK